MTREEMTAALRELMQAFDYFREKWVAEFGSEDGFAEWFKNQVMGMAKK